VPSDSTLGQARHPGLWLSKLDNYADLPAQLERTMLELVGRNADIADEPTPSSAELAAGYHLSSGGQRVRGRLALSAGLALGLSKPDALCIAAAAELLHNASLVHDDLQDRDELRHGQPAVWTKYGANVAVCTGDLMLSAAYAALCGVSQVGQVALLPKLLALVHARVADAIAGQCADLSVAAHSVDDLAAYKRIAQAKSGALLGLPLELALLASGHGAAAEHARDAAMAFSVGYQVVDDLADVERDTQSGALNIVFVLQQAGFGVDAYSKARQFGMEYVNHAISLANELPRESGALLMELSLKLRLLLLVKND
jgi:geranylgeranyl pyrophosphate synthase